MGFLKAFLPQESILETQYGKGGHMDPPSWASSHLSAKLSTVTLTLQEEWSGSFPIVTLCGVLWGSSGDRGSSPDLSGSKDLLHLVSGLGEIVSGLTSGETCKWGDPTL